VVDLNLPKFVDRLVALVEITYTSPASALNKQSGVTYLIAPGIAYMAEGWDVAVEALIPGNRATGTHVGVIAQFHLFLDDLFPNSIGKPIFP
jgi:hypothetical protein